MQLPCVVVGAGPAGVAVSARLAERGVDHVVLERREVASTWREQRWDAFRLNTSPWMNTMLGEVRPDEFFGRDEVVRRLEGLAESLPVRTGSPVTALVRRGDGFVVSTPHEQVVAGTVVLATGMLNVPRTPALAHQLPDDVLSIDGADYRDAGALPPGGVLVVGGGQSGVQIAEDLAAAGRRVLLSTCHVGRYNWRYRGRETFAWLDDIGYWAQRPDQLPDPAVMRLTQPLVASGGRTLSLPLLARRGVTLLGRLTGIDGATVLLDASAAANVAAGDEGWARMTALIDAAVRERGIDAPPAEDDEGGGQAPVSPASRLDLHDEDVGTVIWSTGFTGDLSYADLPLRYDDGRVRHTDSAAAVPGVWFAGFPWLVQRRSSILYGMPDDAVATVDAVTAHLAGR